MSQSPSMRGMLQLAFFGVVTGSCLVGAFEFGKRAGTIDRGIRDHGLTCPGLRAFVFTFGP